MFVHDVIINQSPENRELTAGWGFIVCFCFFLGGEDPRTFPQSPGEGGDPGKFPQSPVSPPSKLGNNINYCAYAVMVDSREEGNFYS